MDVRSICERESPWLLDVIRALVLSESPSGDIPALNECARRLADCCVSAGATVQRLSAGGATADHLLAEFPGAGPCVLLLGHFDTVWPTGQLLRMPMHEENGRLHGPGVLDMKAGLAIGLVAIRALAEMATVDARPRVLFLATSDEEVGSGSSRAHVERLAGEAKAVLVFEPALPNGALKTARRGVGEFEIVATGISAHAGVAPEAGASAIHALARAIIEIEGLADPTRGLTVNVGVIEGGSRPNVVAEHARARIDVRLARLDDAERVETAFAQLAPQDSRVTFETRGGVNRPPMERSDGVARLFDLARQAGHAIGLDVTEGSTGGGSDGNFTAALGVPTLDGLGATGDGPHALHEHVIVKELPIRAALLAGILSRLGAMR